eukprot:scaffold120948_cov21-Tisochrysis_lutea.AAC.1
MDRISCQLQGFNHAERRLAQTVDHVAHILLDAIYEPHTATHKINAQHNHWTCRCGRERLAGYRYILRPAPVTRPTALEQLRQQIQQQLQQQPGQQQPEQQQLGEGVPDRSNILSTGVVPLAYGGTLTAHGRLKPALFFPELPLAFMSHSHQPMQLPIEQLRAAVAEAAEAGILVPPTHASAADGAAASAAAAGEGRGGRSAAAAHDAIEAQKRARKDAM